MSDGTFRGRWVDEVFRSPLITDAARVALLALVPDMDEAGRVSVSREDLAARLNRGKARITERLQAAVDAGLLDRTAAGKKGRVAEYVATLPKGSAHPDRIKGPPIRTESNHFGSGLQTLSEPAEPDSSPDKRTESTAKGSAYPDPLYRDGVDVSNGLEEITPEALFDAAPSAQPEKPRKKRSPSLKTTIPEDFAVTADMRAWAADKAPDVEDIDLETQLFINHFLDRGVKRPGWRRSWESWMLRAQSWAPKKRDNVRELRPTGTDGRYAPGSGSGVPPRDSYDPKRFI